MDAFSPSIFKKTPFNDFVSAAVQDLEEVDHNDLIEKVIQNNWAGKTVMWKIADEDCCLEFPMLTLEELK